MKIDRAQLHCLSDNGDLPCFLLEIGGLKVLLDFPLSLDHLKHFVPVPLAPSEYFEDLPEKNWYTKEVEGVELLDVHPQFTTVDDGLFELDRVDFVLISNAHSLLGLPFLFKLYPELATCRRALCTEPTIQLGRLLAEEIIDTTERLDSVGFITEWQKNMKPSNALTRWHKFYTRADLDIAIEQTRSVSFGEVFQLNEYVDVLVLSSGYSIGSCNWLFQCGKEPDHYKIGYLSRSSSLSTHPRPLSFDRLTECDVAIVTQLTRHPSIDPNQTINGFCNMLLKLLQDSYNVLVPCHCTGIIYDLFECLSVHMSNSGIKDVSLLFVSPVSDQSLAFSNIFCEYLSDVKAQRTLIPDYPFGHTEMIRINQLRAFRHIYPDFGEDPNADTFGQSFKSSRQVIFCGHPSLRMGESVHFMELFRSSPESAVVFVEPDYCDRVEDALAPYRPMAMKHFVFPLDTSLNYNQATVLLKQKLRPGVILACPEYVKAGLSNAGPVHEIAKYETKEFHFPRPLIPRYPLLLELGLSLADSIQLNKVEGASDAMVARFVAVISANVPGRHKPSFQYGGLIPYVCEMPTPDIVQRCFRRQYVTIARDQMNVAEFHTAMSLVNLTVSKDQRNSNAVELKYGDRLSLDINAHALTIECDDFDRRKLIKQALRTICRPLFAE